VNCSSTSSSGVATALMGRTDLASKGEPSVLKRPAGRVYKQQRNMTNYICITCGTQFGDTGQPPSRCPVCEDERQYVNWDGQQWTTLEQLRVGHSNRIEEEGQNLFGIGTEPSFAIGQRALLVQSPG